MNKSDLIETVASRAKLTNAQADKIINTIFDAMTDALVAGDRIEIRGFGSFEIRDYDGYTGRNPKTGELTEVQPKKSPFFKVGKELKERIMSFES
jgi:integration host factor subunit beta